MSTTVTLRGTNYTLAQDGDSDYGAYMTQLINALVNEVNDTALATTSASYDVIVSTDATKRTHATLESAIADVAVAAGSNVLIDGVAYTQAAQLDISKSLNIFGLGNSEFIAGAGVGANALIKISANDVKFKNIKLTAGGTSTYAVEIAAGVSGCALEIEISGAFATGDLNNASTDEAIAGYVTKSTGNYLLPISLPGANNELSNLAPTNINEDLHFDTDDLYEIGSVTKEVNTLWVRQIKHEGDSGNYDLEISTTDNDGNILISPVGAGVVTIDGTIDIESSSIVEDTEDFTIAATGAGKDLNLQANTDINLNAGSDTYTVDISGSAQDISWSDVIQDYTVVGNVGDASQWMAGYTGWTIAELEHFFGAGKIYSYNKFAGGALGTDTNGAYDYTLGAAAKEPSSGIGIEGVADTAISFDGGDYATNATKLDNMTTVFSGVGKGFVHSFWVIAPSDGQPAAVNGFFSKTNSAANDLYQPTLDTTGQIYVNTKGNSASAKAVYATTVLPNGANTIWTHVVICWDTTYGLRLFINGVNEATDSTATTLMVDGTTTDYYVGGRDATPSSPFTGRIAQEIIINKVAEQRDIDILFATTRPEPAILAGKEYTVIDKVRPEADTNYEIQGEANVLAKHNSKIWLDGRSYGEADTVKLIGSVM